MRSGLRLGVVLLVAGCGPRTDAPAPPPGAPTFADEFDGTGLDLARWNRANPLDRIINDELQAYVPEAVAVRDGHLVLTAERRPATYHGVTLPYRSGTVTTHRRFAFLYGRVEVRARAPAGRGLWPGIWLLPESRAWPPEIDLLEMRGQEPRVVHQSHHWRDATAGPAFATHAHRGEDYTGAFHTFAVTWTSDAVVWSIDGVETHRTTGHVPTEPMYLNLALAVGGHFPGPPDDATPFPARLEVDFVRITVGEP